MNRLLLSIIVLAIFLLYNGVSAKHKNEKMQKDWWEKTIFYQIYPRSFMDSNGDGIGDLKGITSQLQHLKDVGIGATWLSPIFTSPMVDFGYDISDYFAIQPEYGTMADFDELIKKANELEIKIILDFVPNHSSNECEWFLKSSENDPEYADYYVWHDGKTNPDGGDPLPPNNWVSVFRGSAWEWHPIRKQFYFHQFTVGQPDLNFRNPKVVEKMKEVMRFWLGKGVAGFRIDAVNHLFEVEDLRDEPRNPSDNDPESYGYLTHDYTCNLMDCYDMIYQWREVLDSWKVTNGGDTRIMMTEAWANISFTMKYYESDDGLRKGSHMPFNFLLITDLDEHSSAQDFVHTVNKWMSFMPAGNTANWVLGNHDKARVGSRYGYQRIDSINAMLLTLPGAGITYNGEEIGMLDYDDISWEDTKDPAACNTNSEIYKQFTRDPERTPFQWDSTKNAGFSSAAKTWLPVNPNYNTLNLEAQKKAKESHYKFYKTVSELRTHDTFRYGDIKLMAINNNVFAYVRELLNEDTFVVLINLGGNQETVNLKVFATLKDKLKVVAASSGSDYEVGDKVKSDSCKLVKFGVLVLTTNMNGKSAASQACGSVILAALIMLQLVIKYF